MINAVAQEVLGRNRSLSVDGLLRSARIWAWQRKYKPAKMKLCLVCHNPFASSKLYKLFGPLKYAYG